MSFSTHSNHTEDSYQHTTLKSRCFGRFYDVETVKKRQHSNVVCVDYSTVTYRCFRHEYRMFIGSITDVIFIDVIQQLFKQVPIVYHTIPYNIRHLFVRHR